MKDSLERAMEEIRTIMETDVIQWAAGVQSQLKSVTRLPGDASTRTYHRVLLHQPVMPGGAASCIVMRMEPYVELGRDLPFLVVREHLEASGVRVPRVFDLDPARGLIVLEDLGDVTLLRLLQDCSSSDGERHYYERVIDLLVEMQVRGGPEGAGRRIEAFDLAFDVEKLMWECRFTIEHFYEKHLQRRISDEDRKVLEDGFGEICRVLAAEPRVLAHRDFHSRNVMVLDTGGAAREFVMIDFQDARMGPAQYDLVSLLRDSYYQLEESQMMRLLDYYIARYEAVSGRSLDREHFGRIFDLMAVQRNFKAIGSFASFLNRRGNATYLKYIGNTFENIRRTLLKHPRFSRLREVLFHYYYF